MAVSRNKTPSDVHFGVNGVDLAVEACCSTGSGYDLYP